MQQSSPFPFQNASLCKTLIPIIPEIYQLTVTGVATSFDPKIHLVKKGVDEFGNYVVEVRGAEGPAIGQFKYKRTIDIPLGSEVKNVMVVGAEEKTEILELSSNVCGFAQVFAGSMRPLELRSVPASMFEPLLTLKLQLNNSNDTVTGTSIVMTPNHEVIYSNVYGTFRRSNRTLPDDVLDITLTGTPEWTWPSHGGIGPVIPNNFKAQIQFFDANPGNVEFEYRESIISTTWEKSNQEIRMVNPYAPKS